MVVAGAVLLLAAGVGLPLLARVLAGRATWRRPRYDEQPPGLRRAVQREHGLTPVQMAEVERALLTGRRLDEERLRAAALEWGLRIRATQQPDRSRRSRMADAAVLVWTVLVVGVVVVAAVTRTWYLVSLGCSCLVLVQPWAAWEGRRSLRRALERNGPAGGPDR